jgi:hypothetical protein
LHVLLHKVAGAKSFENLRSFEGVHYNSFKDRRTPVWHVDYFKMTVNGMNA